MDPLNRHRAGAPVLMLAVSVNALEPSVVAPQVTAHVKVGATEAVPYRPHTSISYTDPAAGSLAGTVSDAAVVVATVLEICPTTAANPVGRLRPSPPTVRFPAVDCGWT